MEIPLISIPSGTIQQRDARSQTVREVDLRTFHIGRTQVTNAQWAQIPGRNLPTDARRQNPTHPVTWFEAVAWCNEASTASGLEPAYETDGDQVSWNVASEGYRLPTEAEWEFAARAGTGTPVHGALADIAWTAADALQGPQDVGLKAANAFGLHDMIGNVWEWCWDYADTARYGSYRSLRGGGWDDKSWSCRASVRRGSAPDAVLEDVGFRVARGAVGEADAGAAQGWSALRDRQRADLRGPLPVGWTPLRSLLRD